MAEEVSPRPIELRSDEVLDGVTGLIGARPVQHQIYSSQTDRPIGAQGNTPLVRINSLSNALGVEILGKAEVRLNWLCVVVVSQSNLFPVAVPQPRGERKGPRRTQKYARHTAL